MRFLGSKIKDILICSVIALLIFCTGVFAAGNTKADKVQALIPERGISHHIRDYLGFNGDMLAAGNNPWGNEGLLNTLKNSNVSILRYPGGTLANFWDMSTGWIDQKAKPDEMPGWIAKKQKSKNKYTLDDLALACSETTQIKPFLVANMLTQNLNDFIKDLKELRSRKIPVKYIELGNEFFYAGKMFSVYVEKSKNGYVYAKEAQNWIKAIKHNFPDAEVGIVANLNTASNVAPRRKNWNRAILKRKTHASALIVHFYFNSGISPEYGKSKTPVWGTKGEQQQQYENMKKPGAVAAMLQQPSKVWQEYLELTPYLKSTKKNIWITEFNLNDTTGPTRQTWAHGLVIANTLNVFLQDPRIEHVLLHDFFSYPNYTAVFPNSNMFAGLLVKQAAHQAFTTKQYDLTATGQVIQLFATAMHGMGRAVQLKISDTSFGWIFAKGKNDKKCIVVNNGDNGFELNLTRVLGTKHNFTYEQYYTDPLSYPVSLQKPGKSGKLTNPINIPPYSITLIVNS